MLPTVTLSGAHNIGIDRSSVQAITLKVAFIRPPEDDNTNL
jgi:hypothetical protein